MHDAKITGWIEVGRKLGLRPTVLVGDRGHGYPALCGRRRGVEVWLERKKNEDFNPSEVTAWAPLRTRTGGPPPVQNGRVAGVPDPTGAIRWTGFAQLSATLWDPDQPSLEALLDELVENVRFADARGTGPHDAARVFPPLTPGLAQPLDLGVMGQTPVASEEEDRAAAGAAKASAETGPATLMDKITAGLASEGEAAERGTFSIDVDKAAEKLERWRRAGSDRYVLDFIQVAVLRRATRIEIRHDFDDLWITFDGRPFDPALLDRLATFVYGSARDDDRRAYRKLAIALSTAEGLRPRVFEFISVSRSESTGETEAPEAVRLTPTGSGSWEVEPCEPLASEFAWGTMHFHVRLGWLKAAMTSPYFRLRRVLFGDATTYCPIRVSFGGDLVRHGALRPELDLEVPVEGDGIEGVAGLRLYDRRPGTVLVGMDGIVLHERTFDELPPGFFAVVMSSRVSTDLSGEKVIEDAALADALQAAAATLPELIEHLLAEHAARHREGRPDQAETAASLRAVQRGMPRLSHYRETDGPVHGSVPAEVVTALFRAEVWPNVGGDWISLSLLARTAEYGEDITRARKSLVQYRLDTADMRRKFSRTLLEPAIGDAHDFRLLLALFGELRSVDDQLVELKKRA